MKYQSPNDVEATMDRFVADNPAAGWRATVRAFERAMIQSMREGGSLFKEFDPWRTMTDDDKPTVSLAAERKARERDFTQVCAF